MIAHNRTDVRVRGLAHVQAVDINPYGAIESAPIRDRYVRSITVDTTYTAVISFRRAAIRRVARLLIIAGPSYGAVCGRRVETVLAPPYRPNLS
jgi:hypothetical protein